MTRRVIRSQLVYAIERNGTYWTGTGWHFNINLAKIMPKKQQLRCIRIDIGMGGCELVEIMPVRNEI